MNQDWGRRYYSSPRPDLTSLVDFVAANAKLINGVWYCVGIDQCTRAGDGATDITIRCHMVWSSLYIVGKQQKGAPDDGKSQ